MFVQWRWRVHSVSLEDGKCRAILSDAKFGRQQRTMSAFGTKRTSACALHMSAFGTKRTSPSALHMSAFDPKRASLPKSDRL